MKNLKYTLFFVFSISLLQFAFAEKPSLGIAQVSMQKMTMKENQTGKSQCLASFEASFESMLQQSGLFTIVDRNKLKDIMLEQDLNASGLVSDVQAKKYSLTGAKYLIFPIVSGYELLKEVENYKLLGQRDEKFSAYFTVSAKIVDASKGTIFRSVAPINIEKRFSAERLKDNQEVVLTKFLSDIGREAAVDLVKKVTGITSPAKILAVNGNQILINRGSSTGFIVGKKVVIYATESIKDPDSGEVFINEVTVGKATVSRGDERKSFALLEGDNAGVSAKNCIVKVID